MTGDLVKTTMRNFAPAHFDWQWDAGIATVSLHGAARKNPLTFESYAELLGLLECSGERNRLCR